MNSNTNRLLLAHMTALAKPSAKMSATATVGVAWSVCVSMPVHWLGSFVLQNS